MVMVSEMWIPKMPSWVANRSEEERNQTSGRRKKKKEEDETWPDTTPKINKLRDASLNNPWQLIIDSNQGAFILLVPMHLRTFALQFSKQFVAQSMRTLKYMKLGSPRYTVIHRYQLVYRKYLHQKLNNMLYDILLLNNVESFCVTILLID